MLYDFNQLWVISKAICSNFLELIIIKIILALTMNEKNIKLASEIIGKSYIDYGQ